MATMPRLGGVSVFGHAVSTARQRRAGAGQVANAVAVGLPVNRRFVQGTTTWVATATVIKSVTPGGPVVVITGVLVQHLVRHQRLVRVITMPDIGRNRLRSYIHLSIGTARTGLRVIL